MGIQHLPVIVGLRRGAVNTGKWEDEYGTKLFLTLERNGNSLGFAAAERQKFIEKNGLPFYDGSQEYCLWLGCMGSYDPQGREIVLALARVLRHLGITFGVLRREKCTGDPARRLGNDLLFQQMAEANIEQLNAAKVGEDGLHLPALRAHHRDGLEGVRRGVRDRASQRIAGAPCGARLPSRRRAAEKVVFHDPCYLGRYRDVYDAAARGDRAFGRGGGSAARAPARVLLRRRRRPDVPGRGEGQARERGARRRTGGDGRGGESGRPARSARPCSATPSAPPRRKPRRNCSISRRSRRHRFPCSDND